jgi:transcription-repair coupling factor (superfamily II helicase)
MPTAQTDAATAASAQKLESRESAVAPIPRATPFAALPSLAPTIPLAGQRARTAALTESADSLALTELALAARAKHRTLAIVCADALATARIAAEIGWFAPDLAISVFPDWETLPYDHFSPHQDLVSERLATLYRITRGQCDVALVAAQTALYRLAPQSFLAAHTFFLTQGEKLDVDALRSQLALAGYTHVTQVVSPGEFSIRGGLIDLFPMGAALPYRLDLFGDEIESIKTFDADTQRTLYPMRDVRLLPAREFPLDEAGRTQFRGRFREVFEGDPSKSTLYKDISAGIAPGGIEYYLPLFFDATATFIDYFPRNAVVALHGDVDRAIDRFWEDTESRYRLMRGDKARPLLPPPQLFLPHDEVRGALRPFSRIDIPLTAAEAAIDVDGPVRRLPSVQVDRRADDPLAALKQTLNGLDGRMLICAEGAGRRETMQQYFAEYGVRPAVVESFSQFVASDAKLALTAAPLHAGFAWPAARLAFVTEAELYANVIRRGARDAGRRSNVDAMVRDLSEVRIGDPVVHEEHGIGRYLGLITLDVGPGARHGRRALESLRAARRANRARVLVQAPRLRGIRRGLRLRRNAGPAGGNRCGDRRFVRRPAHGSARLRRRRFRQDGSSAPRGFHRIERRQTGRAARADDVARRAALPGLLGPLRRLAGEARRAVAFSLDEGSEGDARRACRGSDRSRHRHAQAAPIGREVQEPRPRHH